MGATTTAQSEGMAAWPGGYLSGSDTFSRHDSLLRRVDEFTLLDVCVFLGVLDITANLDRLKVSIEGEKCGSGGFLVTNDSLPVVKKKR